MSIVDFLVREEKGDVAFRASTYLETGDIIRVKYLFGRKQQEAFLKHFFSIRGDANSHDSEQDVNLTQYQAILSKMVELYAHDISRHHTSWAVANLINLRLKEGYSLSESMTGIFDVVFLSIIQALESNADKNVAIAVDMATKSAMELKKAISKAYRYSFFAFIAIITAISIAGKSYTFYVNKIAEDPKKYRFIELPVPEFLYKFITFLSEHLLILVAMSVIFLFINNYILKTVLDERRTVLDKYYPPAIFVRYVSSVRIFSALSLLVSTIGKQTLDALNLIEVTCTPYEKTHINLMIKRLKDGEAGTNQLNTGLLSDEVSLSLRMANLGPTSTVKTALKIIANEGQSKLIQAIVTFANSVVLVGIVSSIVIAVLGVGVVIQVFINSASIS